MYALTSLRTIDDQTRDKNALDSRIDFLLVIIFLSSFLIISRKIYFEIFHIFFRPNNIFEKAQSYTMLKIYIYINVVFSEQFFREKKRREK